jgi:hypothetical protein
MKPKVKQLEWFEGWKDLPVSRIDLCEFSYIKIQYEITLNRLYNKYTLLVNDEDIFFGSFDSILSAQKAAQEHFDDLILSCLELEE